MIENFDKKKAKEFIFEGESNEIPCIIKNLAINNLNVFINVPNGKKLYVLDYKNSSLAEIESDVQSKVENRTDFEKDLFEEKNKIQDMQDDLQKSNILSDIYEYAKPFIYEEKMPAWNKLISTNQQAGTLKSIVDALSVMRSLENGDFELAKATLKQLSSTEEKSNRIQKIVALYAKQGPEFFEFVNNENLSESDKVEIDILKGRNEVLCKREKGQTPTNN